MSNVSNAEASSAEPMDFYDLAAKFAEETSTSDQPHRLLKIWARRFPEHAADLAAIAYARLAEPTEKPGTASVFDQDAVVQSAKRVLDRFSFVSAQITSISGVANALGISAKALADHLRIDVVLLAKLEQRLLEVQSIPASLINCLAEVLNRTASDIVAYLAGPPRLSLSADYKSVRPPSVSDSDRQTFAEALSSSRTISAENRIYWENEISKVRHSQ